MLRAWYLTITHVFSGLHREDLIMEQLPGVKEALRRLPQDVIDARYFRLKRVSARRRLELWGFFSNNFVTLISPNFQAINISARMQHLPKEEWTTESFVCLRSTGFKYFIPRSKSIMDNISSPPAKV